MNIRYDMSGNLTNDGICSYSWNGEGMLKTVTSDPAADVTPSSKYKSEYAYDGMGRKVRATDSEYVSEQWTVTSDLWYLYDGWNCVAELLNQSSSLPSFQLSKSYMWGLDLSGSLSGAGGVGGLLSIQHKWFSKPPHLAALDKPPHPQVTNIITYFVFYDGNGNVVNLLDMSSGSIAAHYEYDPFGRLVCKEGSYADDNEYRFSTKRYCAMWSLYDYGYRHYSPDLGRWMSRDRIAEENCDNPYSSFANCPVTHYDALGLTAEANAGNKCGPDVTRILNQINTNVKKQLESPRLRMKLANFISQYEDWDITFIVPKDSPCPCGDKCQETVTVGEKGNKQPRGFLWMS